MDNFNLLKTNIESKLIDCLKSFQIDYVRKYEPGDEEQLDTIKLIAKDFIIWIYSDTLLLANNKQKKDEIYREIWDYKSTDEKVMIDNMIEDFIKRVTKYLKTNYN